MTEEQPLVSIVTPSYNQERFIEETILSVKNQDYPNIEHIIVDGGSTDNTLEVIKKYEGTYNMRWISEPDEGQADAVNKGFTMVRGGIIGWLNSDDLYFDKQVISAVVRHFSIHLDADVVYGNVAFINRANHILRILSTPRFSQLRLQLGNYIPQPSVFFKREVVVSNKLDIGLCYTMDYEYWFRLGSNYKFVRFNRVLAADRNHLTRKVIAGHEDKEQEIRLIKEKYRTCGLPCYLAMKVFSKCDFAWKRVKGLSRIIGIHRGKSKELAFTANFKGRHIWNIVHDQLIGHKTDLL